MRHPEPAFCVGITLAREMSQILLLGLLLNSRELSMMRAI
jgi:hypothetical protein